MIDGGRGRNLTHISGGSVADSLPVIKWRNVVERKVIPSGRVRPRGLDLSKFGACRIKQIKREMMVGLTPWIRQMQSSRASICGKPWFLSSIVLLDSLTYKSLVAAAAPQKKGGDKLCRRSKTRRASIICCNFFFGVEYVVSYPFPGRGSPQKQEEKKDQ